MALSDMTPAQFLIAAQQVIELQPNATLRKNKVGNLSVMDIHGDYIGWVNLRNGEVTWFDDEDLSDADAI